jgi:hypothetical protein
MMLQMLLGPREFFQLLRHSSLRVATGLELWHIDVGKLRQLCARAAAGWGKEVALLCELAFGLMVVERPQERFSGAQMAALPHFNELPSWGELAELAQLLPPQR